MSPTPKKDNGWTCGSCGTWNESFRTQCMSCKGGSSEIVPFQFPATGQPVRTVMVDGRPWFIAADVCAVLGYSNGRMAVGNLPDRMKGSVTIHDGTPGNPNRTIVSEPGVYRLAMRSNLPEAEAFQDWIAEEVIPAIRRTGSYAVAPRFEIPQSFAEALELAARQTRALEAAQAENAELRPSAHAWNVLASGRGDYSVSDAAKILTRDPEINIGRDRLFRHMEAARWIYRQRADGRWRAYQASVDNGRLSELPQSYEHPKTGEVTLGAPQLRVTPKGLAALHRNLGGVAPLQLDEEADV